MFWAMGRSLHKKQKGVYRAPDFALTTLNGEKVTLKSFKGKPLVINFWATWCPPCLEEMPVLQQAYMRYRDRGLVIFGIAVQDQEEKVKAFVKKHKITFPVALDTKGNLPGIYGIQGVPESFFVDRKGMVQAHIPQPLDELTMLAMLEKIL